MWANLKYLNYTSFVREYVTVGCDIIDVAMATQKVHIKSLQIPVFATYLKSMSVTYPFHYIFRELRKSAWQVTKMTAGMHFYHNMIKMMTVVKKRLTHGNGYGVGKNSYAFIQWHTYIVRKEVLCFVELWISSFDDNIIVWHNTCQLSLTYVVKWIS